MNLCVCEDMRSKVLEDHKVSLEQAPGGLQLEELCPSSRTSALPELLSPAAVGSHGLLHSDRHGDQGGRGFVTVVLSKWVRGETNVRAGATLHVLYSALLSQKARAVWGGGRAAGRAW